MPSFDWSKKAKIDRLKKQGYVPAEKPDYLAANDPIKVAARRRKRERDARPVTNHVNPYGLDKVTFKALNREYKALRLSASTRNTPVPSYNDWMRERVKLLTARPE